MKAFAEWIPTSLYGQRRIVNEQMYSNQTLGLLKSYQDPFWQATTEGVRCTVQMVKKAGRGIGMVVLAASGVVAGFVYAARKQIASMAAAVYYQGKRLVHSAISALTSFRPSLAFGG